MKTNIKKISAVLMVFFMLALSACAEPYGVKKVLSDESESHVAYYYTRRGEMGTEHCVSLLKTGEELDMEAVPNVYISENEVDFDWGDDMLAIFMHDDDEDKQPIELDGILVVYGYLS